MPTGISMPTGMHCILVGACHKLLAGCKCEVREAWMACSVTEAQSHDEGRVEEVWLEFRGVHGSRFAAMHA